jgi:hypothetical protein
MLPACVPARLMLTLGQVDAVVLQILDVGVNVALVSENVLLVGRDIRCISGGGIQLSVCYRFLELSLVAFQIRTIGFEIFEIRLQVLKILADVCPILAVFGQCWRYNKARQCRPNCPSHVRASIVCQTKSVPKRRMLITKDNSRWL